MWIVNALLLHTLLLGSIFVIYFRSPVITGLSPQPTLTGAPAQRLILIVTDGLRAESFFHNECEHIPFMREVILRQGVLGLSHTRVPTESRPGHIALIAGLYEDPSAVTRGWKENPIDFDTVFNRSQRTFAWGAHDVLSIFSKITADGRMVIDSYDHELDFSGQERTEMLDSWVFDRVKFLLNRKRAELQSESKTIYFLHLLGLDSAGHIHKPGSKLFVENLKSTDAGIFDVYQHFEKIFPDGQTAYVLTSDHGMTDTGSHGSGAEYETRTPLFLWGAGIKNWRLSDNKSTNLSFVMNQTKIPLYEVEQAQIAPIISTLIGIAPPMNNFGILPVELFNVTEEYSAKAMMTNSKQLLSQYEELLRQFEDGTFSRYLPGFEQLNRDKITNVHSRVQIDFNLKNFNVVIDNSRELMREVLVGIDYFQTYYKTVLLMCTTLTVMGWMIYMVQILGVVHTNVFKMNKISLGAIAIIIVLLSFIALQKVPLTVGFYIILPVLVCHVPIKNWTGNPFKSVLPSLFHFQIIVGAEIIVISFFHREFISGALLLLSVTESFHIFKHKRQIIAWIIFSAILAAFPLFPNVNGQKNDYFLALGILTLHCRSLFFKFHRPRLLTIFSVICSLNIAICVYFNNNHLAVPTISLLISWISLPLFLILPLVYSKSPTHNRVQILIHCLTMTYCLLCTSYEAIFVVLLSTHVLLLLGKDKGNLLSEFPSKETVQGSFRTAFIILVYTFFSFFGTGNIASISSFDPNIIRCFLSTFSPFIIMFLVIVKLIIPVILVITIIFGLAKPNINERQVFICLLYICDIMGLNFLFLVRNTGSWLEIGSSISHFVIMEVTTLVLVVISILAKLLLRIELGKSNDHVKAT